MGSAITRSDAPRSLRVRARMVPYAVAPGAGSAWLPSSGASYIRWPGSWTMATAITEEHPARHHEYARIGWWIRVWLWVVATMIMVMVVVGGTTRLTHSGLSITDWQLIHGIIPPLSTADWQEEFAKYKQIPEFQLLPAGMTLDDFKVIFGWEYAHRLLGRIIGLAVLLPLIFLWATGRLERVLMPRLVTIAGLVIFQGVVGWWMVESGLQATDVSPLWLTFHLTLG